MKPEDGIAHDRARPRQDRDGGRDVAALLADVPAVSAPVLDRGRHPGELPAVLLRLRLADLPGLGISEDATLEKREVVDAARRPGVQALSGYLLPRGGPHPRQLRPGRLPGADLRQVLKYDLFPLPELLSDVLAMGAGGHGLPGRDRVRGEPAREARASHPSSPCCSSDPMTAQAETCRSTIRAEESARAFCTPPRPWATGRRPTSRTSSSSTRTPSRSARTIDIAREVGQLNAGRSRSGRKYLLIGPGRWGSADRWLGIPVKWADISGVSAMVETTAPDLRVDPSQGSHFFHNITTLDITYCTVNPDTGDRLDWAWLDGPAPGGRDRFVAHVRLPQPFVIKADGRTSRCVMIATDITLDPILDTRCRTRRIRPSDFIRQRAIQIRSTGTRSGLPDDEHGKGSTHTSCSPPSSPTPTAASSISRATPPSGMAGGAFRRR